MTEENNTSAFAEDEGSIDLLELVSTLWKNRKKVIKWCAIGAVVGIIVAFSIPKEYTSEVKLAPEIGDSSKSAGSLGALASIAGISTGSSAGADAVYPMLYPDVVSSVPFLTSLFDVEVELKEGGVKMPLSQYIAEDTRRPWWSVVMGLPFKLIGMLTPSEPEDPDHHLDNFRLTKKEDGLVKALKERIVATVDAKTSVVTVSVRMQDPLVSGMLADTVVNRLKEFITLYRTDKARQDLAYAELLNDEAQQKYYKAQQILANYIDRNQGIAFRSAQIERDRLENEATVAFNLYSSTTMQVQRAQAKVQENTPVFAVLSPATVPIKPSKPSKALILVGFTFLAFVACAVWLLFLKPMIEEHREKMAGQERADVVLAANDLDEDASK